MEKLLKDEVALITGASRGIGLAIALELGRKGAFVVGTSTSTGGAESIDSRFKEYAIEGQGMVLNITDADSIEQLLAKMTQSCGPASVLVNNAGITRDNLLMRMKEEDWDVIIDTNLKSVFRLSRVCIKPMIKARRGRIISISSVVAATGNPGQANYAAWWVLRGRLRVNLAAATLRLIR
jgi:3-oxoacyl-[acyl-carrier protein] reductase